MPFSVNDPIIAPSRGTPAQAIAYAKARNALRMDQVERYVNELWRLCNLVGVDFSIAWAQFCDETGTGTSSFWRDYLNPGGIGALETLDRPGNINYVGGSFASGEVSARAHMVHLWAYARGRVDGTPLAEHKALDPRYDAVFQAGYAGKATNIAYLSGRWAANPNYANQIVAHATAAFGNAPTTQPTAPGATTQPVKPPTPRIVDRWLHQPYGALPAVTRYIPNRNGQKPSVIVVHIQDGTSEGSFSHFHSVTASSTVFVNRDGSIWRLVPEQHGPWTNGDDCNPTAKGAAIINRYGPDPNAYSLTIETEGYSTTPNALGWAAWPKPQAQLDSVVWQVMDWMERYGIPIDRVIRHADLNQCDRPYCPGNDLYNYVMARIAGKTVTVQPSYAKPSPVPGFDGTEDIEYNGALFHAEPKKVRSATDGVSVRQWATVTALPTRGPLKNGEIFDVLGWVNGEAVNNEARWWVTKSYSRIWVGGTVEKPTPAQAPEKSDNPPMPDQAETKQPAIVNGVRFYPVGNQGGGRRITIKANANLRKFADPTTPIVGEAKAGSILKAGFWVIGSKVDDESIWWVIGDKVDGPRLWAGATNERPF